ncbi:MAG: ATP-binding protein [Pseudomonadota bacterium]
MALKSRNTQKSASKILSAYPQFYIIIFLAMVAALLVWQAHMRIEDYHRHQQQIAAGTVSGVVQELNNLLLGLRRSVSLFADTHQQALSDLINDPKGEQRRVQMERLIQHYFPQSYAFTLSNGEGDDLLDPLSERITEVCKADIRKYVRDGFQQNIHIHSNPSGYHFDIKVPLHRSQQRQGGVFFISFYPSMLSSLLANSQVTGHQLLLLRQDEQGRRLIEVTAKGSRNDLDREGYINPEQMAGIAYAKSVPGTRWQLVDIPLPELYSVQRTSAWVQMCSLLAIFLGTGLLMLYLIKREGSQRQYAEDSLRESYAALNAVFEGIGDPMYIKDLQGRYRMVNSAFAELAQKSPGEFSGRTDSQLFPPPAAKRFLHGDKSVLERGEKALAEEYDALRGERHYCLVTRTPVKDPKGNLTAIVGIRHDITELKLAEERIRMHERELAHVDRLNIVGEMASSIAHEINQPLGAVANCAQAGLRMVRSGDYDERKLLSALELANQQAQRAGKIVLQIRDFARKETRPHALIDLTSLIEETVAFFQPKAREHCTTLMIQVADQIPKVYGDRIQVEQVLLNLMINAIEAMQDTTTGPKELKVFCCLFQEGKIRVTIKDTGPGLDAELAARIFEPFFTTKVEGMGLGLAISRTIIESHSGHLWVETEPNGGTVFHFTLPVTDQLLG